MAKFLADENVPREVIDLARGNGLDITWVGELSPGIDDDVVLNLAYVDDRVLITFDKDFGEMAFRLGKQSSRGVLLLRPGSAILNTWLASRQPF